MSHNSRIKQNKNFTYVEAVQDTGNTGTTEGTN